jgi:hypothetical protein
MPGRQAVAFLLFIHCLGAHEGRAGMSAVDSATRWGRLGGAVAAGRRRSFVLVFHRALPDLQRMKHKPDQAFGHREVFCFFLADET